MTFVRVTRDQRGYETTFLMHTGRPGDRPRVLYWYRTAPAVMVGRPALDEEAIRAIEDANPEIEFDWPHLLEEVATALPEVERRPERRRKPVRPAESAPEPVSSPPPAEVLPDVPAALTPEQRHDTPEPPAAVAPPAPAAAANPLLEQLVGREIANRLRTRHAEIAARLAELSGDPQRAAWQGRVEALDPDRWLTSEAVLHGIQHADRLFDELRRDLHMTQ